MYVFCPVMRRYSCSMASGHGEDRVEGSARSGAPPDWRQLRPRTDGRTRCNTGLWSFYVALLLSTFLSGLVAPLPPNTLYSVTLSAAVMYARTRFDVPVREVQIQVAVPPAMAAPAQQFVAVDEAPDTPNHGLRRVHGSGYHFAFLFTEDQASSETLARLEIQPST